MALSQRLGENSMTRYTIDAAFDKITDGIAEAPAGQWTTPDQAEEACRVYLLSAHLNEGDSLIGDPIELIERVREWMEHRGEE
jgi:hypothetical protein